jgi:hypothetical protein
MSLIDLYFQSWILWKQMVQTIWLELDNYMTRWYINHKKDEHLPF